MEKKGRLHLRLAEDLEKRMHDYVDRHNTTLSAVATALFQRLLDDEEAERTGAKYEAEQV